MTPPGSQEFVVFAREDVGSPTVWDYVASAWEVIPSSPSPRFTKRVELAHASWSPYALSWPECVMLGVDRDDDEAETRMYRVDYGTWDVRLVTTFRGVSERAADSRHLYLWASAGSRRPSTSHRKACARAIARQASSVD